jgi:hypothetical protein
VPQAKAVDKVSLRVAALLETAPAADDDDSADAPAHAQSGAALLAAFKALKEANDASTAARVALAAAADADGSAEAGESARAADAKAAPKGGAKGGGVAKRKLAKGKATGLTPAKGAGGVENTSANAVLG